MPYTYTKAELQFIARATALCGQMDLTEQLESFLKEFPNTLDIAKDYFSQYLEYTKLREDYAKQIALLNNDTTLTAADLNARKIELKNSFSERLAQLETNMRKNFVLKKNDPESDLKRYLHSHFLFYCHFDNLTNNLGLTPGSIEYLAEVKTEMEEVSNNGFTPAYMLYGKVEENVTKRNQIYLAGANAKSLECGIMLADRYLNDCLQGIANSSQITEEQAISFIKEGIKTGNPTAIAAMGKFVSDCIGTLPFLYKEGSTAAHRKNIIKNKKLALLICDNEEIKKAINNICNFGEHTNNPENLKKSKEQGKLASEKINALAKTLKLSTENAREMGQQLALEKEKEEFLRMLDLLKEGVHKQEAVYERQKRSNPLSTVDNELRTLKHNINQNTIDMAGAHEEAKRIIIKLQKETASLKPSNPLKQLINYLMPRFLNMKFKSGAHKVAKKSEAILKQYGIVINQSDITEPASYKTKFQKKM
jgi:hypothetical protein